MIKKTWGALGVLKRKVDRTRIESGAHSKPMNIWYFTFEYPPYFGGGLAEYMRQLTLFHAARPSDRAVIFTLDRSINGLYEETDIAPNIKLIKVNVLRGVNQKDIGYWVSVSNEFSRLLLFFLSECGGLVARFGRPQAIEFADGFGIGYIALKQRLALHPALRDIPIIILAHTPTYFIDRLNRQPIYKLPVFWHGLMERECLSSADAVISPSKILVDRLAADLPCGSAPVAIIRNPYEPEGGYDQPLAPETGDFDHFYMASRLTHWKGVNHLVEAFALLWSSGSTVKLRLYGKDTIDVSAGASTRELLEKRFARYVDKGLLIFEGLVPRAVIEEKARRAYAQIHPSLFDNFPYSVLEAMSSGGLCIINKECGVAEISDDGLSVIMIDSERPETIVAAVERVIRMTLDDRARMRAAAREVVRRHCSYTAFAEAKTTFLEKLVVASDRSSYPFFVDRGVVSNQIESIPPKNDFLKKAARSPVRVADRSGLTVAIPYFNMGAFIDATLHSVFNSSYQDLYVNLVDDGSTDYVSQQKLDELEDRHADKGDRFRILRIPNGGVANARNHGIRESRTEFVTLLDADDLVHHKYYERAVSILKAYNNVSFVGCWIEDFNEDGRIRNWATWNAEPPLQLVMNQTNCQSLVYRRSAFLLHGQHDPSLRMFLDDWEGMISLIAHSHRGVMIPEPLFFYRIRGNSIFRSRGGLWDLNFESLVLKHGEVYDRWGRHITAFLNANGPNNFYHIAGKPSALSK